MFQQQQQRVLRRYDGGIQHMLVPDQQAVQ
jgi:hypothetical protein